MGRVEPAPVRVPPVPPGASDAARRVRDGFALAAGLLWAGGDRRPIGFPVGFCAAWCDVEEGEAAESIDALVAAGVLARATAADGSPRYLPGGGADAGGAP